MSIFPAISLILSFIDGACAFNLSDIEPNEPPVNAESITPLPTLEPLNTSPPNVTSLGAKLPFIAFVFKVGVSKNILLLPLITTFFFDSNLKLSSASTIIFFPFILTSPFLIAVIVTSPFFPIILTHAPPFFVTPPVIVIQSSFIKLY